MTIQNKVFRINGKEITKINFEDWSMHELAHELSAKVNLLIEALSDKEELKQEEWKGCGICNCKYPQFCEGCYKADYKCRVKEIKSGKTNTQK